MGGLLFKLGRMREAIEACEGALRLRPDYPEAHHRMGNLLTGVRGYAAAEPHFRRAVELQPAVAVSWCNLGVSLVFLGRLGEAMECFNRAIALDPKFDHAYAGLGLALSKCYRQAAAAEAYGRALAINPHNHEARSARLYELQYLSNLSREELWEEHLAFGKMVEQSALPAERSQEPLVPATRTRRLRVGFLSPDLHRHSVAYFLEPLLAHLDRGQFEVFLYHDQPTVDEMSERLRSLADTWGVVSGVPDNRVETLLRGHALDILVDLAGHTGYNRLPLYARRLAPVQVTYLGYPDTTGLAAMDYRLVDPISDPEGRADRFATEKLVRFAPTAWSYSPPADAPEPAPSPAAASGRVTFGCFNNFSKVNDGTLRVWSRLLAAAPGSRLVLKGHGLGNSALHNEARRRLAAAGIGDDRGILLERTPTVREHLEAYAGVDLALDTFPYNGTTTTCEALWMGVPMVALAGDRHSARVGASLLTAVGHPEWIAADAEEYVRKAVELARAVAAPASRRPTGDCPSADVPAEAGGPRMALREAMRRSVLLDHAGQATRFGTALKRMWEETMAATCVALAS